MAISEKIKKVIGQLTGDGADAQRSLLNEILGEVDTLLTAQEAANGEAQRRRKANEKYEAQIAELNDKLEQFANINTELDRLKKVEADYLADKKKGYDNRLNEWKAKAEIFAIDETDRRFDKISKIRADFHFPADEKSELTPEQVDANLKAYELLSKANYFEQADTDKSDPPPRPKVNVPSSKAEMTSGQAAWASMKGAK